MIKPIQYAPSIIVISEVGMDAGDAHNTGVPTTRPRPPRPYGLAILSSLTTGDAAGNAAS